MVDRSLWNLVRRRRYNAARRLEEQRQLLAECGPDVVEFLRPRQQRLIARREFLRRSAMGAGGVGLAAFLAACGDSGTGGPSGTASGTGAAGTGGGFESVGRATFRRETYPTYEGTPAFKGDAKLRLGAVISDPAPLDMVSGLTYYYGTAVWMYDWLIDLDPVTLEVIPSVAESWEISTDGRTYTFHLRGDAFFWDGSPVTSEDVKFTMLGYRNEPLSTLKTLYEPIESIETPDERTVVVHLSRVFAPFLAWGGQMFIGKKSAFDGFEGRMQDAPAAQDSPIGSGPWIFEEVVPGSHARFSANQKWFRGAGWDKTGPGGPYYGTLIQNFYADYQSWLVAYLGGEVDTIWPLSVKDVETVGQVDSWIYDTPSTVTECMVFNFNNPSRTDQTIFGDVKVRQALYHAIDVHAMGQGIWKGFWEPRTSNEVHPWMLRPYEDQVKYEYDPARAKSLLAEAGWVPGSDGVLERGGEKFEIRGVGGKNYLTPEYAQVVQQYFKEVGVAMDLQILDSAPLREVTRNNFEFDVFFRRHFGWGYPDSFRELLTVSAPPDGLNYGRFTDPGPGGVDDLWNQIMATSSDEEAIPLFYELQDRQAETLPALFFGAPHDLMVVRKNVLGHQPNPMWQDWDPMWWYPAT